MPPSCRSAVRECGQKVGPDWVQDWSPYGKLHARAEGTGGGALQRARLCHRNGAQARVSQQAEALRLGEPRRRRPQAHLRRTLPALRPRNQVPGGRDVPRIRRCDDGRRRPGRVQRRHRLQLGEEIRAGWTEGPYGRRNQRQANPRCRPRPLIRRLRRGPRRKGQAARARERHPQGRGRPFKSRGPRHDDQHGEDRADQRVEAEDRPPLERAHRFLEDLEELL